jgi:molybdate transport system substrate-binding protein
MKNIFLFVVALLMVIVSTACNSATGQEERPQLTIFAAAQLQDAFNDLRDVFEERIGARVDISYAGSQVVRTQIEQGAYADIFASADLSHMQALQEQELVGEDILFSNNTLTVMLPKDNPAGITSIEDLGKEHYRLVIGVEEVPIGIYTRQFLEKANDFYGGDFKERVLDNTVSLETNTRAVTGKITLAEGDVGMTYVTDVTATNQDRVMTIEIPEELNVITKNTIAITRDSKNPELAQQWVDFVLSEEGQEILANHKFIKVIE